MDFTYNFIRTSFSTLKSNPKGINWPAVLSSSLLIVSLKETEEELKLLQEGFKVSELFFTQNDEKEKSKWKVSSKFGYKKNIPKERYQVRKFGSKIQIPVPTNPPHFQDTIFKVYDLFENIGYICLNQVFDCLGINGNEVLQLTGDPSPLPENAFSTSVFNIFHYYNTNQVTKHYQAVENCIPHFDPGFISVLGRANVPGLDIQDPLDKTLYSSDSANFENVTWINFEQFMEETDVVVILGETLQRLSGGKARGTLHRVSEGKQSRYNLIFEIRPLIPIYHSWDVAKQEEILQQKGIPNNKNIKKNNTSDRKNNSLNNNNFDANNSTQKENNYDDY